LKKTASRNNPSVSRSASLWEKAVPLLVLTASFLFCFREWFFSFSSKVFLSLDMTFAYYPLYHWVHEHLAEGRLPLISDLAYHGAPIAAVVMIGILSPALWLFHAIPSFTDAFNLLFLVPSALYLFGSYCLGRKLGISRSGSLLLSFLWAYNGHQMAQLDHLNVAWAHAFFPWSFLCLVEFLNGGTTLWLLASSFLFGLNVLSGHPQVAFLEGLFFITWIFFANRSTLSRKLTGAGGLFTGALFTASPLILFTLECRGGSGFNLWEGTDRFFHSWTPLNFITLILPWFFGRDSFDRVGGDYWWQYQFVEMQVAFSIVGLFFILLFLGSRHPQRRWIIWSSLFALFMAFGRFTPFYAWVLHLPLFSWFRDPARYWFLITWTLGLGAAYGWDEWFKGSIKYNRALNLALGLFIGSASFVLVGCSLFSLAPSSLDKAASWLVSHFPIGDSLHTQPLSVYLSRLPEKLGAIALNLDPREPRVFIPLLLLAGSGIVIRNKQRLNLNFQKTFLLTLVFVDLMIFRMPLGNSFYDPSIISKPLYPPAQNRSLVLLSGNVSPLPSQYGEMAFPNVNFLFNRPNLALVANPPLPGYDKILKDLGWFSWVYKDRDPLGFTQHVSVLQMLGVDQIVSDVPLKTNFRTVQNHYPYVYAFPSVTHRAVIDLNRNDAEFTPLQRIPLIREWGETHLSLSAEASEPATLILQKTFLPGWKARVNEREIELIRSNLVLIGVPLETRKSQVELKFDPASLRLGFFLFFLLSGLLSFTLFRRRLA
jgi:hypothetical protein